MGSFFGDGRRATGVERRADKPMATRTSKATRAEGGETASHGDPRPPGPQPGDAPAADAPRTDAADGRGGHRAPRRHAGPGPRRSLRRPLEPPGGFPPGGTGQP